MKDRLIFDTTDATTIAATDSVGAYLRSADGTLLTHTDVGGKKALDVRVAEGINVEVDLSHVDDSVKIGDGTDFMLVNADGSINAVVSATNLDIRDLVAATDAVSAWTKDGTGTAITSRAEDGGQALDVHVTGSGPLTVNDAALANTAIANAVKVLALADTAEAVVTSALASRKYLMLYNNDNTRVFIGAATVTAANGFPMAPGSYMELRAGAAVSPFFVGQTGKTPEIRSLELS